MDVLYLRMYSSACGTVDREREKNSGVEIRNFVLAKFFPENNQRTLLYTSTAYVVLSKPFLRIRDSIICDELRKEIIIFFFLVFPENAYFIVLFNSHLIEGTETKNEQFSRRDLRKKTTLKSLHNRRTYIKKKNVWL